MALPETTAAPGKAGAAGRISAAVPVQSGVNSNREFSGTETTGTAPRLCKAPSRGA